MSIVFVTGAGISAPSGIPTYRSEGSGWDNKRLEEISQYNRYGNHLDELWEFWYDLYMKVIGAQPNKAHFALSDLSKKYPITVLTQNVDGLHLSSGLKKAVELHGSMWFSKCMKCKHLGYTAEFIWDKRYCPECRSDRVRPDVTLFGEPLRREAREALTEAKRADCVVFVGTSGSVWPCAGLAETVRARGSNSLA